MPLVMPLALASASATAFADSMPRQAEAAPAIDFRGLMGYDGKTSKTHSATAAPQLPSSPFPHAWQWCCQQVDTNKCDEPTALLRCQAGLLRRPKTRPTGCTPRGMPWRRRGCRSR